MNLTNATIFPLLFLLFTAEAMAAPTITVDKAVRICQDATCSNSTTVKAGLEKIALPLTAGIRSLHVYDWPAQQVRGNLSRLKITSERDISFYVRGMNTSEYRKDFVNTHNAQVLTANQELSSATSRVSSLETEVELKNNRIRDLELEIIGRDDRLDARDIVISIMAFLLLGELAVIFIVLNMKGEEA